MDSRIILTGVPGVGKTTVAKELAKILGMNFFDIESKLKSMGDYREEWNAYEVDLEVINEEMIPKGVVVESHLFLHKRIEGTAILLRRDPVELAREYRKRKYKIEKALDNLYIECTSLNRKWMEETWGRFGEIAVEDKVEKTAKKIVECLKTICREKVDWNDKLEKAVKTFLEGSG